MTMTHIFLEPSEWLLAGNKYRGINNYVILLILGIHSSSSSSSSSGGGGGGGDA
jgi:hypothetical protein